MKFAMRFARVFSLSALILISGAATAPAQETAAPKNPSEIVTTHSFVSLDSVPRGKEFQAAIVVKISTGYHMNSHKPSDSYLIPTTLTPELPTGFKLVEAVYPAGRDEKFPFSPDKPLNVYSGSVTLRLRLTAEDTAALGAATIPVTLRFQACNLSACLPPVKVPVKLQLQVVAAGAASHPTHPEIFSAKPSSKS
jgi:DsbC/DsbD-like thiol-disulfide interchange protein